MEIAGMHEHHQAIIDSPIGKLGIATTDNQLISIDFLPPTARLVKPCNALAIETTKQLQTYFKKPNFHFNLSLQSEGTLFQNKVWKLLTTIPVGTTRTYKQIASTLKSGPRAVGNACRNNPIPIIIPCHRVVAVNHLGGYSGARNGQCLTIKKWLLAHEQIQI